MEFFNKKEDVIGLQLTQYGRHLMSKGKFKPVYYSFYDDNVLYNSTRADVYEAQNDSEARIRETQTMRPQVGFSSLEREFLNNYDLVVAGHADTGDASLQRTPEKHYILGQPIGTSDVNSEYSPSWSVLFLNGHLSGSNSHMILREKSKDKNILSIPQLFSHTTIDITSVNNGNFEYDESLDGPLESDYGILTDEENTYVMLKVIENNGPYQKKNFDIEMFEVVEEEKKVAGPSATLMVVKKLDTESAKVIITFTDKPNETTTITLVDSGGTSATFEVDGAGNGVTSGNIAMVPETIDAAGMGDILASAVNASGLDMSSVSDGSGQVTIQQLSAGAAGNTTITYSDSTNWGDTTSGTLPTAFTGGGGLGAKSITFHSTVPFKGLVHGRTGPHTITISNSATSATNVNTANCNNVVNSTIELRKALQLASATDSLNCTVSEITNNNAGTANVITLTQNWTGPKLHDNQWKIEGDISLGPAFGIVVNSTTYDPLQPTTAVNGPLNFEGEGESIITETLRPLKFSKPYEIDNELSFMGAAVPKNDQNHVEYYFDIRVDDEIGQQHLCRLDPVDEKLGVHADERITLCQDVLNEKKKKAVGNIYTKGGAVPDTTAPGSGAGGNVDGDSDVPGEIC